MAIPKVGETIYLVPFSEPLQVYEVKELAGRIHLGVIFIRSKRAETLVLTPDELAARLKRIPPLLEAFRQRRGLLPRDLFLLSLEALRLRLAYLFDPLYAVSVTQVDLLPHQVDAVYRHILPLPIIRFLLADDPGLGKTIMAGLTLKELKARELVNRCLIIVPAHLQDQWWREMKEWFREEFVILKRDSLNNIQSRFFDRNPQLITSMDFAARNEKAKEILGEIDWDLVIVDEAHKFSATRYGAKVNKTKRYQLGEVISPKTKNLLFLTATPHKGDDGAYFLLLDLLEPRLFPNETGLRETVRRGERLSFVLRRSKEEVTDLKGNKLFRKRKVQTLSVPMTEAESILYQAVTNYVRRWYPAEESSGLRFRDRRSRNVALALTVLQRRVTSSLAATRESLRRRCQKLEAILREWNRRLEEEELPELDEERLAEIADQTAHEWENLQERLEGLTAAQTPEELKEEIEEINNLISLALQAERTGEEAKVQELRRVLEERLRYHQEEKLLIFSEFKDTVLALRKKLENWGFHTAMIHGEMDLNQRMAQERIFRHDEKVQVMVATDAAAEGINLQFCRFEINFDLPWNPNRLEQRMGRIHRYGQVRDCFIWNMLYEDTREGDVLQRLLEKLERMRERPELGDTIYDVISVVLEGVRLEDLIVEAILKGDSREVEKIIEVDFERRIEEYSRALKENALAGHHIDPLAILKEEETSKFQRLVPWDVEFFTHLATQYMGGALTPDQRRERVFRLGIPPQLQKDFRNKGYIAGTRIAFEREVARKANVDFFAPGHPVLEALIDRFLEGEHPRLAILADPEGRAGSLWLFRVGVKDGNGRPVIERVLALFRQKDGSFTLVDPRWVRNLKEVPDDLTVPEELMADLEGVKEEALGKATAQLEPFLKEAQERRQREVDIKRRQLESSYKALIDESNIKLLDYHRRQERGEDMRLAIQQEEANLKKLIAEKEERLKALPRESELFLLQPELEALALVVPASISAAGKDEQTKKAVEKAGMEFVMRYEREQGRNPQDMSERKLGYDIESAGAEEKRYIEVKAFATTGPLELTPHEWQIAQRLEDAYWLYIVENALTQPQLTALQNPASVLEVQPVWEITGFSIADWREQLAKRGENEGRN